jgi:hypothetical protein
VYFHGFHGSYRFGPFLHVFQQFFVQFFVPAGREKAGIFNGRFTGA